MLNMIGDALLRVTGRGEKPMVIKKRLISMGTDSRGMCYLPFFFNYISYL